MKTNYFKPVVFGIFLGAGLYFIPFFIFKMVLFIALVGGILRLFWWRKRGHYHHWHLAYAEKIRNMNEEEFTEYKNKMSDCNTHGCYRHTTPADSTSIK